MPDENDDTRTEDPPSTPLHAHAEGREKDVEGDIGGGEGDEQDADTAENTGGSTSGRPGGASTGDDDPSNESGESDAAES
jgi:hypothetical protein